MASGENLLASLFAIDTDAQYFCFVVHVRISLATRQLDGSSSVVTCLISAVYDNKVPLLAPASLGHWAPDV